MIIGRMDKRITLLKPVKIPDEMGGYKQTWENAGTVWAEFKKPSLSTVEAHGTVVSEVNQEIAIRYREDVRRGWRVEYRNRTFTVEHTYDYGRESTVMICRELVK